MFTRAVRVATVRGVEVRLDPSLLLIVVLLVWTLRGRFALRFDPTLALTLTLLTSVLVILSVLAHELGHALEALQRGGRVGGITLFALGGATELGDHGRTPRDELGVAAIGPWVSLVLAAAFGLVATGAENLPASTMAAAVGLVAGVLGWSNLGLAVFNALPAAPLDGGRMLHALVWRVTRDRAVATTVSALLGQLLGAVLIVLGAWTLAVGSPFVPAGGTAPRLLTATGGVWSVLVGVFLVVGARAERRRA
jgi:Zn-dependent protease